MEEGRQGTAALIIPAIEFTTYEEGLNQSTFPRNKRELLSLVNRAFHESEYVSSVVNSPRVCAPARRCGSPWAPQPRPEDPHGHAAAHVPYGQGAFLCGNSEFKAVGSPGGGEARVRGHEPMGGGKRVVSGDMRVGCGDIRAGGVPRQDEPPSLVSRHREGVGCEGLASEGRAGDDSGHWGKRFTVVHAGIKTQDTTSVETLAIPRGGVDSEIEELNGHVIPADYETHVGRGVLLRGDEWEATDVLRRDARVLSVSSAERRTCSLQRHAGAQTLVMGPEGLGAGVWGDRGGVLEGMDGEMELGHGRWEEGQRGGLGNGWDSSWPEEIALEQLSGQTLDYGAAHLDTATFVQPPNWPNENFSDSEPLFD